ncbi:MAG: hypothetical protein PSY12_14150 [bacterium]|nr:hypothetical protein [bacterium]
MIALLTTPHNDHHRDDGQDQGSAQNIPRDVWRRSGAGIVGSNVRLVLGHGSSPESLRNNNATQRSGFRANVHTARTHALQTGAVA